MVSELATAYAGLSTALGIVKGVAQMNTDAQLASKTIELGSLILDAQQSIMSANSEIGRITKEKRELEEEVARLTAWNGERERYVLAQVGAAGVGLALKESQARGEPPHYLCANCANTAKKVILNVVEDQKRWTSFHCSCCDAKISTGYSGPVPAQYAVET